VAAAAVADMTTGFFRSHFSPSFTGRVFILNRPSQLRGRGTEGSPRQKAETTSTEVEATEAPVGNWKPVLKTLSPYDANFANLMRASAVAVLPQALGRQFRGALAVVCCRCTSQFTDLRRRCFQGPRPSEALQDWTWRFCYCLCSSFLFSSCSVSRWPEEARQCN
jgi:hypothetical protein